MEGVGEKKFTFLKSECFNLQIAISQVFGEKKNSNFFNPFTLKRRQRKSIVIFKNISTKKFDQHEPD